MVHSSRHITCSCWTEQQTPSSPGERDLWASIPWTVGWIFERTFPIYQVPFLWQQATMSGAVNNLSQLNEVKYALSTRCKSWTQWIHLTAGSHLWNHLRNQMNNRQTNKEINQHQQQQIPPNNELINYLITINKLCFNTNPSPLND